MTKRCPHCERDFEKPGKISRAQWEARHYCSYACARDAQRVERPLCACGCGERTVKTTSRWKRGHDKPQYFSVWKFNPTLGRWYIIDRQGVSVHWARVVMEDKLGRPLRSDEHVHHLNGDRTDDRPENLELLEHGEHSRRHMHQGDFHRLTDEDRERGWANSRRSRLPA